MGAAVTEAFQQDRLAMSVARALALANETAIAHGTDPAESLVTITEEMASGGRTWRIHDGPRDYIGRRGGDLIVLIDGQGGSVENVIHGQ